jgi:hypothetical protein
MSVLQNQTFATVGDPFFVPNDRNINFISSINVYNGSINVSEINLDAIRMDCAIINSTPTLLLNSVPVASTSSFTSSITTWSSYPALAPITYAVGGGTANLNNINALTSLSSATVVGGTVNANTLSTATATISSINGVNYPIGSTAVLTVTGSPIINGAQTNVDFSSLSAGLYLVRVYIASGGNDPFSCSTVVTYSGGVVVGGSTHCPSIGGAAPSFLNCVSIQDNAAGGAVLSVIVFATSPSGLGAVPQIGVYRLT